ncbi:hypothetical protein BMJ34_24985 [Sinorhizobium medicae]|nr:hypothetical protein BMJ34_24985 [Sinorhizobium medicae]PLU10229.1 hypothetical protein BMJ30_33240 [Sinorhizobium medicae]PLU33462.1 hypothetical protein BMJ27_17785 [Sinorhizobium medicae]
MPFAPEFDDIYKLGIQETAADHNVVAERVDEQFYSETMIERIYRQIDAADFIIADMTGKNPNVFYEVGYAHAKGKLCTLLTQETTDIPFDLKHHRHLVYGGSIRRLKALLATELEWLKDEIAKRSTNPYSVEIQKVDSILVKTTTADEVELTFRFDMFNNTGRKAPDIEAIYLHTAAGWKFTQNGAKCASSNSSTKAERHFIRPPVTRLVPNSWAQIEVTGSKRMWSSYTGKGKPKDSYTLKGYLLFEIVTAEGIFQEKFNLNVTADEFPF